MIDPIEDFFLFSSLQELYTLGVIFCVSRVLSQSTRGQISCEVLSFISTSSSIPS